MNPAMTLKQLQAMKDEGRKIACLTAYDATFARLFSQQGVDMLLVGDSLGMTIQGQASTVGVSVDDMIYHARAVRAGSPAAWVIVDMPFLSYADLPTAVDTARRLMGEGQGNMVKLEGAGPMVDIVQGLSERGVPVCAHLGLTPQSVDKLGGYRVQGRDEDAATRLLVDARTLEAAGADLLVLECVPAELGRKVSQLLEIPVIGIGAGPDCDGQVLVSQDMLGLTSGKLPRFVRNFMAGQGSVADAVAAYVAAVREGRFPAADECY